MTPSAQKASLPETLRTLQRRLQAAVRSGDLLAQSGDFGFASAPSNIALLKYWGKRPGLMQVPVNPSVSYRLGAFRSQTRVRVLGRMFPGNDGIDAPRGAERPPFRLSLGGAAACAPPAKMQAFLEGLLAGWADEVGLHIESHNNFPTACGVASSASGYAALAGAIADAFGLASHLEPAELQLWLSEWARLGSGSATRSAWLEPDPFVTFEADSEGACLARALSASEPLLGLRHLLVVVSSAAKEVSSSAGHGTAHTAPLQAIRVAGMPARFSRFAAALRAGDFCAIAALAEEDAAAMHAVMQTQSVPQCYLSGTTAALVALFIGLRDARKAPAFWTLDAGPNLHLLAVPGAEAFFAEFMDAAAAKALPLEGLMRGDGPEALVLGDARPPGPSSLLVPATGAGVRRLFA